MEEQLNLSAVLDQVCDEKKISREVLIETVEQAVATAAKKVFEDKEIEASFDPETYSAEAQEAMLDRMLEALGLRPTSE